MKLGAPAANTIKWVEGDVFSNDFTAEFSALGRVSLLGSFKSGKTHRFCGNYRLASDCRFSDTFLCWLFYLPEHSGRQCRRVARFQLRCRQAHIGKRWAGHASGLNSVIFTSAVLQQPPPSGTALYQRLIDPDLRFPQVR